MYAIVIDPSSGEEQARWLLGDSEPLNCDTYAARYADCVGMSIAPSTGHIPNCCGDFRVELRKDPNNSVCIWSGESYYFEQEDC